MNLEMQESEAHSDIVDNVDIADNAVSPDNSDIANSTNIIQNCSIISNTNIDGNINTDSSTNIVNNARVDCTNPDSNIHDVFEDDTEIFNDEMHEANAASFVGGYIAHVALKKFQCTDCQASLVKEKEIARDQLFIYFKEYDDVKNGLKAPSNSWLKTICEFGRIFVNIFKMYSKKQGLLNKIIYELKSIDHDWIKCASHGQTLWEDILKKYALLMLHYKLKYISSDINNSKRVAKKLKKLT